MPVPPDFKPVLLRRDRDYTKIDNYREAGGFQRLSEWLQKPKDFIKEEVVKQKVSRNLLINQVLADYFNDEESKLN